MNVKGQERYMFCDDCGFATEKSALLVKNYRHKKIVLCKKCASKLEKEINRFKENKKYLFSESEVNP